MTIVGVIVALIFFIFGWILFAKFKLYVDTAEKQYYLRLKGVVAAHLVPTNDLFLIKLKVPFYTFSFDPLEMKGSSDKKKKQNKSKSVGKEVTKKKKRKSWSATKVFIKRAMATFNVNHFILDLDTGDYPLNAQLIPVFLLMSRGPASLKTNFMGKSYFSLEVENRLIRMVRPAFKYLISK